MSDATNTETYEALTAFIEDNGYPPSMRELGKALGLTSTDSVRNRLLSLERSGMIERVPGRPRAIIMKGKS